MPTIILLVRINFITGFWLEGERCVAFWTNLQDNNIWV